MIRSNTAQPNDADLEQLSAYLDQQLTPEESAALEERLRHEPEFRAALDELRQTISVLRDLGPVQPPRSFTLDPSVVAPRRSGWFGRWFQISGALAAILIAFASIALLNQGGSLATAPQPAAAPVAEQATPPDSPLAAAPTMTAQFNTAEEPLAAGAPQSTPAPAATNMAPAAAPADIARTGEAPAAPLAAPESQDATGNTMPAPTAEAPAGAAPAEAQTAAPVIVTPAISSPDTITLAPQPAPPDTVAAPSPIRLGMLIALLVGTLLMVVYLFRRR
jgi:hypothetical protein